TGVRRASQTRVSSHAKCNQRRARRDTLDVTRLKDDFEEGRLGHWVNLYLSSVKLVKKVRVGSKLRRVYEAAKTPLEPVLAGVRVKNDQAAELKKAPPVFGSVPTGEGD